MRLRQIALVAAELEPIVSQLCDCLDLEVGFRDPGVGAFGLQNAVIPVGDTFLEVVSPTEAGTTAGRLLERRGGDGGYMVLLQTDDLQANRKRLDALGVRVVWEIELEDIAAMHLHPKDVGGAILSLDRPVPAGAWRWGGPEWEAHRRTATTLQITGVDVQTESPAATAKRWSQIVDHPAVDAGQDRWVIALDGGVLRFVPATDGRGDGVSAIELLVRDRARVQARARELGFTALEGDDDGFVACGTRIRLRNA